MARPMAYAPTVQAEAGFTHNSMRHYGEVLGEPRTDSLSHPDVYAGLRATIAILAALHRRAATGTGQYIDVAMAATLMAVNERAHVDLNDAELGLRDEQIDDYVAAEALVGASIPKPANQRN